MRTVGIFLAVMTLGVTALLAAPQAVSAHGNLDQTVEGDPGCNTSNFAAAVTANGGQRQTFIPTGTLLSSVGLCVSAAASNTALVVGIYGPGGLLGGGSSLSNATIVDSAGPPVRYVHVDFLQPITVSPGALHAIEIQSGATVTWYGTAAGSPYSYCHGAPNSAVVGDFGFHTYVADAPGNTAPCPEPPTATPAPPTSTPVPPQPTNTPAPGATTAPANTPASGAAVATQPSSTSDVTGSTNGSPPTGGTSAPTGSTAGNAANPSSGGQALPNAGTGTPSQGASQSLGAPIALLLVGAALVIASHRRQRAS